MAHNHHHSKVTGTKLLITIVLNVLITIAQIIGGIFSGSMALLSDAAHNFSDVIALIISYAANKLSSKICTVEQTYGYKRAEIFAAFINASTLIIIAIYILTEGILHFFKPESINGNIVIYLAGLSIILNGLSVLLIKGDAKNSLNIKSAYLHLLTDMLTSIAVLISGLLVKYYQLFWFDSVISIGIAFYLIYNSWGIFITSLKIMMQFTPKEIDIKKLAEKITALPGIKNIHHIHVWQLGEHDIIFDAHIDTEQNILITDFEKIHGQIGIILDEFDVHHFTIQPEYAVNDNKNMLGIA